MEKQLLKTHNYLVFAIKALNLAYMWPRHKKEGFFVELFKEYFMLVIFIIITAVSLLDFVHQFQESELDLISINDNITASSVLFGILYISFCFRQKKYEIQTLVHDLQKFESYCPPKLLDETDKNVTFYTKFFIIYGFVGNICYTLFPFLSYNHCKENRTPYMIKYGIPCGLASDVIFPIKMDYTPMSQIAIVAEIIVCTMGSLIVLMVTMLLSGLLMHIAGQLKHLKDEVLRSSYLEPQYLRSHINFCVKYHIAIIEYADRTNKAFSLMMLLHISWTSLVIGVLGFQVILLDSLAERIRYLIHLTGWLLLLFIVSYYGQTLIDESSALSAAYDVTWYDMECSCQRDFGLIIMRAQYPLTLKAIGLKEMSLATYLGVLYTAYSYFTLLLKFQAAE